MRPNPTAVGTLQAQLYYPFDPPADADLSKEDLRGILARVDLEHLVERAGVLSEEINWEDELSLGEKQRLAIARLLHQRPAFAILDECSSAISDEMTRRLYRICQDQRCAYITIAHRPALKAYHDRVLSIGDGKQGFTLEPIPAAERAAAMSAVDQSAEAADGADAVLRAQLEARSAKYAGADAGNKEGVGLPQRSMLRRGLRITRIGWIDALGPRLAASLAGITLQLWMQNFQVRQAAPRARATSSLEPPGLTWLAPPPCRRQMMNVGHMFGCLMTSDLGRMARLARDSLLLCVLQPVVYESVLFLQREIGHDMMEKAQDYMMERLLRHDNFYKLSVIDGRIKDTKQRVCGDCHEVFHHFDSLVVNGLVSFLKLIFYTARVGARPQMMMITGSGQAPESGLTSFRFSADLPKKLN